MTIAVKRPEAFLAVVGTARGVAWRAGRPGASGSRRADRADPAPGGAARAGPSTRADRGRAAHPRRRGGQRGHRRARRARDDPQGLPAGGHPGAVADGPAHRHVLPRRAHTSRADPPRPARAPALAGARVRGLDRRHRGRALHQGSPALRARRAARRLRPAHPPAPPLFRSRVQARGPVAAGVPGQAAAPGHRRRRVRGDRGPGGPGRPPGGAGGGDRRRVRRARASGAPGGRPDLPGGGQAPHRPVAGPDRPQDQRRGLRHRGRLGAGSVRASATQGRALGRARLPRHRREGGANARRGSAGDPARPARGRPPRDVALAGPLLPGGHHVLLGRRDGLHRGQPAEAAPSRRGGAPGGRAVPGGLPAAGARALHGHDGGDGGPHHRGLGGDPKPPAHPGPLCAPGRHRRAHPGHAGLRRDHPQGRRARVGHQPHPEDLPAPHLVRHPARPPRHHGQRRGGRRDAADGPPPAGTPARSSRGRS